MAEFFKDYINALIESNSHIVIGVFIVLAIVIHAIQRSNKDGGSNSK